MIRAAIEAEGWNAEAAIGFALAAQRFASKVTLRTGRESVDGKDDIEVLSLNPDRGEEVVLEVEGRDEKEAFRTLLARLLSTIEAPRDRLAAVTGPVTEGKAKAPSRRRTPQVVALDAVEEVAPARPRRKPKRKKATRKRTRKTRQRKQKQRRTRPRKK